jgi:hypothetical protein
MVDTTMNDVGVDVDDVFVAFVRHFSWRSGPFVSSTTHTKEEGENIRMNGNPPVAR